MVMYLNKNGILVFVWHICVCTICTWEKKFNHQPNPHLGI